MVCVVNYTRISTMSVDTWDIYVYIFCVVRCIAAFQKRNNSEIQLSSRNLREHPSKLCETSSHLAGWKYLRWHAHINWRRSETDLRSPSSSNWSDSHRFLHLLSLCPPYALCGSVVGKQSGWVTIIPNGFRISVIDLLAVSISNVVPTVKDQQSHTSILIRFPVKDI